MAKTTSKKDTPTKVTRITASDAKPAVEKPAKTKSTKVASVANLTTKVAKTSANPIIALGRYFKGAWEELRQVRWPDRKSTWGMTGALIAFTASFVVIIVFLDYVFSQLFKLILGSN